MKAIGAKNSDMMSIFLPNSGWSEEYWACFSARAFRRCCRTCCRGESHSGHGSVLTGMVAGAVPAYGASKLKPVDALRYE